MLTAQDLAGWCLRMRFSQGDGGPLDLLNRIPGGAGNRELREQVIDVIGRDPLPGNRLSG